MKELKTLQEQLEHVKTLIQKEKIDIKQIEAVINASTIIIKNLIEANKGKVYEFPFFWEMYSVIKSKTKNENYWHKIGNGFRNSDNSLNLKFNSLPRTEIVVLRPGTQKEKTVKNDNNDLENN